jgi:hypothetical protein
MNMSDVEPHLEDLLAVAPGMRPELRELVLRYVALFAQFDAAYAPRPPALAPRLATMLRWTPRSSVTSSTG